METKKSLTIQNKFVPRDYQLPIMDAILNRGYKRAHVVMPRRAGKDITAFNICVHKLLSDPIPHTIFYCLPTFSAGRRILWDALTSDGVRVIDYLPKEFVESRNESMMRIKLKNQSQFHIIGSDNFDNAIVGTNPKFFVFSEFARTGNCQAYEFALPIMQANGGGCLFISTPRGKADNKFYSLFQIAQANPHMWFSYYKTVEDTKHMSIEAIRAEIDRGEISEALAQQEYWCSWTSGTCATFYGEYLDRMYLNNQICNVPWQPGKKVHCAMDIGVNDHTAILWFQIIGKAVHIIDSYMNNRQGLEHYVQIMNEKPYQMGYYFAPHDIKVKEWGSGLTRLEKAQDLGIEFSIVRNIPFADGIEKVRTTLPIIYIDEKKCKSLITALKNYKSAYHETLQVFAKDVVKNVFCHMADALRYLCLSIEDASEDGLTAEQLDANYNKAMYGDRYSNLPPMFRDQNRRY